MAQNESSAAACVACLQDNDVLPQMMSIIYEDDEETAFSSVEFPELKELDKNTSLLEGLEGALLQLFANQHERPGAMGTGFSNSERYPWKYPHNSSSSLANRATTKTIPPSPARAFDQSFARFSQDPNPFRRPGKESETSQQSPRAEGLLHSPREVTTPLRKKKRVYSHGIDLRTLVWEMDVDGSSSEIFLQSVDELAWMDELQELTVRRQDFGTFGVRRTLEELEELWEVVWDLPNLKVLHLINFEGNDEVMEFVDDLHDKQSLVRFHWKMSAESDVPVFNE